MKCKYKKFLKAAYINYDEDYCGYGSSTFTKPTVTTPIIVITGTTAIIACAISGVTIYYTLDGSTPTSSSTLYTGTITLTLSCTIKAIAVKPGMTDSEVASENYIHYLTAWRLVGNSVVHTDEYLTQWKVSGNSQIQQYLTQWKVEGNSIVSDPSANLPQGYKKCKYLESHGTEYIELPFGFDKTDEVYAKAASVDLQRVSDMFFVASKTWNDDDNRYGLGYHYHFGAAYGAKSTSQTTFLPLKEADVDVHTYRYANELFTFDNGVSSRDVSDITFGSTTDNLRLFHTYNADVKWRIYAYHHIKANNVEVNLIPCLDDNNVPCLYDTISQTTLYNQGTGTFGYEIEQPAILSCGDLGQDGKYHVKISNGVDVFDIALTEPLRKAGNVADSIELINGVVTLTRKINSGNMGDYTYELRNDLATSVFVATISGKASGLGNLLSSLYIQSSATSARALDNMKMMGDYNYGFVYIRDLRYTDATSLQTALNGVELLYELATPTTEVIQAPQISVSSTNTYSSANDTPYSAFTYANPLIYSCGDYSDVDGKYHVKISNGVTIYDISLTEPLRKVNDVADTLEFANGVATVTRNIASTAMSALNWVKVLYPNTGKYKYSVHSLIGVIKPATNNKTPGDILCTIYNTTTANAAYATDLEGISVESVQGSVYLYDANYDQGDLNAFLEHIQGAEFIYALATPTTEVIQVSPFPVSSTDTYTSVNNTPYSAFEYKKNVEIWSCGEYNPTDGKYHILVQPSGGDIADIALDEPLRKVKDVADTIEFADGVATLTRCVGSSINLIWNAQQIGTTNTYRYISYGLQGKIKGCNPDETGNILAPMYITATANDVYAGRVQGIGLVLNGIVYIYDDDYNTSTDLSSFRSHMQGVELIYELATPTTETIQVPQIEEADSYSCVISQGAKAVSWSSFETE